MLASARACLVNDGDTIIAIAASTPIRRHDDQDLEQREPDSSNALAVFLMHGKTLHGSSRIASDVPWELTYCC